ncbi:hypothetical protein DY000_02060107 [Brassica cretica]|uniref:Uncharacterized protein n=1 Tax=Brassica cretica TaxID=69181 RepID=A0ABQ7B3B2_BRACR|nr:hypothetical protein DY000_02060107 [Brassica cretica]
MHGFASYRHFGKARSLRYDRNVHVLGHYVVTKLGSELGRYVATELGSSSVVTLRPSRVHAWSPRIDRAWLVRGPIIILELVHGQSDTFPLSWDNLYLVRPRFE